MATTFEDTQTTTRAGSFLWYELLTSDLAAARDFYQQVVGWKIDERAPGPIDYRMIAAPDGHVGGTMEITEEMAAHGARPIWLAYIEVEDVDAKADAVKRDGGTILVPPQDIPEVGRFALLTDPQGAAFYVMRPRPPAGREGETSRAFGEAPGHIGWNEYNGKDGPAGFDFYSRQFGWTALDAMDMGPAGKYQMFATPGSETAAGGIFTNREAPQPIWLFYFNVDDIDAAKSRVENAGGKCVFGPQEVPGGSYIIQCIDPQGAQFALVGSRGAEGEF